MAKKRCFCYRKIDGTICVDPGCEVNHLWVPPLGWMDNSNNAPWVGPPGAEE